MAYLTGPFQKQRIAGANNRILNQKDWSYLPTKQYICKKIDLPTMKNYLLLLIFFLLQTTTIKAEHIPDSMFTFQYIQDISMTEPHRALEILDEAEKNNRIPMYEINNLRGMVYHNGLNEFQIALDYALKAWESDSIRNDPEQALMLIKMIAEEYSVTGKYLECIQFANTGMTIAQQTGNKHEEANMLLYNGIAKREMGLKKEAEEYFFRTIEIQKKIVERSQSWGEVDDLFFSYGTLITAYQEDGRYQQAIELLPELEELIDKLKTYSNLPDGFIDMRYAQEYITYACNYAMIGEFEKAQQYYERYLQTDYASTPDGEYLRVDYLANTGRYQEALHYIKKEQQTYTDESEKINYSYLHYILEVAAQCYMGLKNYQAAAETYKEMYTLVDSLKSNERQNMALELATIYETNEKSRQITEQKAQLRQTRIILITSTGMLLLATIIIWLITHNLKISRKKNKIMAGQIDELLSYRDELLNAKEVIRSLSQSSVKKVIPETTTANDFTLTETHAVTEDKETEIEESSLKNLFEELETMVSKEDLFLDPDICRDMLIKRLHIKKNVFAQMIQTYAHTNFNGYINNKRLEYSIRLLKDYHNYTIEAVASDSGFNNVRTYYRQFREKYGMTPAEYRNLQK